MQNTSKNMERRDTMLLKELKKYLQIRMRTMLLFFTFVSNTLSKLGLETQVS